jgi:hypothetical protein
VPGSGGNPQSKHVVATAGGKDSEKSHRIRHVDGVKDFARESSAIDLQNRGDSNKKGDMHAVAQNVN